MKNIFENNNKNNNKKETKNKKRSNIQTFDKNDKKKYVIKTYKLRKKR